MYLILKLLYCYDHLKLKKNGFNIIILVLLSDLKFSSSVQISTEVTGVDRTAGPMSAGQSAGLTRVGGATVFG